MRILLDTNILVRLRQPESPQCLMAERAIARLRAFSYSLCIVPQVVIEDWAVCTRPAAANGLGLSVAEARTQLAELKRLFELFEDEIEVFARWERLIASIEVRGKVSYDARLVAAMERHGIGELLTFNGTDFCRFTHITVRLPEVVVAWS